MRTFFTCIGILVPAIVTLSQSLPDSLIIQKSKETAHVLYERTMEGTHHLYNGSEYLAYQPLDEEHPYFLTEEWTAGELKYDGEWFTGVPLLFDIEKEKLVASYYYKGLKMQLINSRIDEFNLLRHRFINIKKTTDSVTMRIGFYEALYDGKTTVLARKTKRFSESKDGTEVVRKFVESSHYYISVNGGFSRISTKAELLRALDSQKKELKSFIRENSLFNKNFEESIVQVARYFDRPKP